MQPTIDIEAFTQWVESVESPHMPFVDFFYGPPPCAQPTIMERVEPFYTQYTAALSLLPDESEYGPPEERFYRPTKLLRDLRKRVAALQKKAYREVPNPDYTEECAAEYRERCQQPYNQITYTVGQSYNPTIPLRNDETPGQG